MIARTLALIAILLIGGIGVPPAAIASASLPKQVEINGVEFVLVPQGWFHYFVETTEAERKGPASPFFRQARVWLDDYYIAKYEARARDFARFMNANATQHRHQYQSGDADGCSVRRNATGEYFVLDDSADLPATHLSWQLATDFARWMGFRLPTEAEWQKAARGTDERLWPWGNEYPDDTYAGYWAETECSPTPVTAFPKGRSPYGTYNMAGNVFEFVQDWHNPAFDASIKDGMRNPKPAATGVRQADEPLPRKYLKGGRWASGASAVAIFARSSDMPDVGFRCYGARFALDASTVRGLVQTGTARIAP